MSGDSIHVYNRGEKITSKQGNNGEKQEFAGGAGVARRCDVCVGLFECLKG